MIDSVFLHGSDGHSRMGWIRGYTEDMRTSTMASFDLTTLFRAMTVITQELEGVSDFFTMGIGLPPPPPRRLNISTF
jgi:hypothetical protein